jgi:hypothetical protein
MATPRAGDLTTDSSIRARVGYGGGDFSVRVRVGIYEAADSGCFTDQNLMVGSPNLSPLPSVGCFAGAFTQWAMACLVQLTRIRIAWLSSIAQETAGQPNWWAGRIFIATGMASGFTISGMDRVEPP